jgi:hypothetical protein
MSPGAVTCLSDEDLRPAAAARQTLRSLILHEE